MPTVVTSEVGYPTFCVGQALVFVLEASSGTCVVPSRSVSSILDTITPGAQVRVPKGARHGPVAVWSAGHVKPECPDAQKKIQPKWKKNQPRAMIGTWSEEEDDEEENSEDDEDESKIYLMATESFNGS
ncbi:hypothetical protein Taro_047416, partial [Colocasia esculenta]|nr:hypothetical protein [Colocasia esculenta]